MIAWGVWSLLLALNIRVPRMPVPAFLLKGSAKVFQGMEKKPPIVRASLLGLSSTFLPCGWLYAYAVIAAGTGSPWRGMIVMAVFWAGTVPILVGLGTSVQLLAGTFRKKIPVLTSIALIVVGLVVLAGRFDRGMLGADETCPHCSAAEQSSANEAVDHVDH